MKADYPNAVKFYTRSLPIREKNLGSDHLDTATNLHNLGSAHFKNGDVERAEPLIERALVIREKSLPPDHFDIGWTLRDLAPVYVAQEQYARAEPLYMRALAIMEKTYGPDDAFVIGGLLEKLAELYRDWGRDAEAETYEKRLAALKK